MKMFERYVKFMELLNNNSMNNNNFSMKERKKKNQQQHASWNLLPHSTNSSKLSSLIGQFVNAT